MMKNKTKDINFKWDVIKDADVISALNKVPNKTKYIKELIRKDLQLKSQEMIKDGR